ncbi:MAG: hypothetical protein H0U62_00020 [Actinobacteria bacterium]|jgi:hypothetical protein|nr:hypothetical protein [Actinomycetota bacterium]
MMSFSGWLRSNSQHYLLIAAHEQVAKRHGTAGPRAPRGLTDLFWLRIFAPVYRALPWPLRHRVLKAMPGSHRKTWAPPPRTRGPAV